MTKPLRLAIIAAFALAAMAVRARACNAECAEGEACNDEAEPCMPAGSFSWQGDRAPSMRAKISGRSRSLRVDEHRLCLAGCGWIQYVHSGH